MEIKLSQDTSGLDSFLSGVACKSASCRQLQSALNFSPLKRMGASITASSDGETTIKFNGRPVSASMVVKALQSVNAGVTVNYVDEDEEDPTIVKTENPLWSLRKSGEAFILKRNF